MPPLDDETADAVVDEAIREADEDDTPRELRALRAPLSPGLTGTRAGSLEWTRDRIVMRPLGRSGFAFLEALGPAPSMALRVIASLAIVAVSLLLVLRDSPALAAGLIVPVVLVVPIMALAVYKLMPSTPREVVFDRRTRTLTIVGGGRDGSLHASSIGAVCAGEVGVRRGPNFNSVWIETEGRRIELFRAPVGVRVAPLATRLGAELGVAVRIDRYREPM